MFDQNQIEVVRRSLLFRDVPEPLIERLLRDGRLSRIDRGETLFVQGDRAEFIYVVVEGLVKLSRITPAGDDIVVAVYAAGESFGEAAALKGGVYPVTVEAAENSLLFQISARCISRHIGDHPELAMAMLASTFRHLHELVVEVEDLKGQTGAQRLAAFLTALAPAKEGPCSFSLPYDKGLIAGRLGMKPESLSRSFANLRREGVTIRGGQVSVADMGRLRALSEAERPARKQAAPCA